MHQLRKRAKDKNRTMDLRMDASQHRNFLGIGEPFAQRWSPILILGLVVYATYRLMNPIFVSQFSYLSQSRYTIPIYYGPAALLLLALFALHRRLYIPQIRFVGNLHRRDMTAGFLWITLVYLFITTVELWLGQPREPTMISLYSTGSREQHVVMVASLLILPPIVEELAFRHFLLSVLPFNASRKIAVAAAVATALFFSVQHWHYQYLTTYLLLFALGIVFAVARIRSGGMLLPITLHSYAIALALVCDQLVASFGH